MAIGFSNIPADIRVPLFYAEMDNSAANSASSAMRRLIVAQVNDKLATILQFHPQARLVVLPAEPCSIDL